MVKFKKYTEGMLNEFLEKNFIEEKNWIWEFIKDSEANVRFDDSKGILTVKIKMNFDGDKELLEDNSWN